VTQTAPATEKPNPLKRRLSDREKFDQQKQLKEELHGVYKTWLDEDVRWIITDTEHRRSSICRTTKSGTRSLRTSGSGEIPARLSGE